MHPNLLVAEQLKNDPRVAQAIQLLTQAVQDHQRDITGVRPPNPALIESYAALIAQFAEIRGGNLWFPYLGSGFGKGALVELLDGSVKYDFACGIGPHYFGHNHPALIRSGLESALSNTVMQGHLQQNSDSVALSSELTRTSGLPHCFLTSSGAMANENALKVAFQKKFPASRVLAFEKCFVGRTITISQITDRPAFREGLPSQVFVDYVPYFDHERPEESTQIALATLKKYLHRYPKGHAVMIFELVIGEGGFYPGNKEFFRAIMSLLKEHEIPIFDDEVQCFGRLPALYAFQYFGLEEFVDIVSIGKLSQVCATLFTDAMRPRPALLSQTFTASTSAIRAGQAILHELLQGGYYGPQGKIERLHQHTVKRLKEIEARHPHLIKGPYGLGCMIGFTPLNGEPQTVTHFVQELFKAGVITFVAGSFPTRCRILPPAGAVTFEDIDKVAALIEETLVRCGGTPCT